MLPLGARPLQSTATPRLEKEPGARPGLRRPAGLARPRLAASARASRAALRRATSGLSSGGALERRKVWRDLDARREVWADAHRKGGVGHD